MKRFYAAALVLNVFLFVAVEASDALDEGFGSFYSWTMNVDSDLHCTMVATTKPTPDLDETELFLKIEEGILDVNDNISEVKLKSVEELGLGFIPPATLDAHLAARSSRWKVKACRSACKEAIRETCATYNCKHVKSRFLTTCKRNCDHEFQ